MRWEGVVWGGSEEMERKLGLYLIDTLYICMKLWVSIPTEEESMCRWRHRGMQCGHESELLGLPGAGRRNAEILSGPPVGAAPTYQHLELRLLSYRRVRECKVLFSVTQLVIPYSNQRRHRWILSLFPFPDEESEQVTQSVWERAGILLLSTL